MQSSLRGQAVINSSLYANKLTYRASQKLTPSNYCWYFSYASKYLDESFTQMLNNKIYTLQPSFVEIHQKLTNLYSIDHDNPHFTAQIACIMQHWLQVNYPQENEWPSKLSRFEPAELSMSGVPWSLEKHHKLQSKPIHYQAISCRVRPIPVSGIGRYLPVSVGIGIGRYLFYYRRRYQ